jgi:5'/3'-nucleotidase SurE
MLLGSAPVNYFKDLPMQASTTVRFSQFNASLNRNKEGDLVRDLSTPDNAQAKAIAEIIQRSNPDVLLINEFDYVAADPLAPVQLFQKNYLSLGQNGANPVEYPYAYIAPSNTGIASGFDLNNNGTVVTQPGAAGYGDDAFGFGNFPGQFGMLLLSKYPIDTANVRTFQNFLWKDMPDSLLSSIALPGSTEPWYSPAEQAVLRLSSKSHWDVPILVNGQIIHALVSHPTPPVFDGAEDRNGKRNYDEIRFWSDYVTPGKGNYIYDDQGKLGGFQGTSFVIMGDQNADPLDGDSFEQAILQLLRNPNINTNGTPTSLGAPQQSELQKGANLTQKSNPAFDTADFADTTPGNLRTDYVLPSSNLKITDSQVFWPLNTDPTFRLVGLFDPTLPGGYPSSDHKLVWADLQLGTESGKTVVSAEFAGQQIFPTNTVQTLGGITSQIGGLSGLTYDAANQRYYLLSDDRGDRLTSPSPVSPPADNTPPRFYTAEIQLGANGLADGKVTFTGVTLLRDSNGNTFAPFKLDPEDIVLTKNNTLLISSEGEVNPTAGRVTDPLIGEFDLKTGQQIRSLPIPQKFLPRVTDTNGNGKVDAGDTPISGVRNNLAFESLTITPDQRTLYTATESALVQDGAIATVAQGSRARIIQYNLVSGQPEKEYLYPVEAIAKTPDPATAAADNGLVDLLAIDNRGTMLALERSFSVGKGNTIRIYQISLQGATDIATIDSLAGLSAEQLAAIRPVSKQLVLNLDDLDLPTGTDNIEGIEFGAKLPDGRQSIVLVSDNNFSANQFTQVLALSADVIPAVTPIVETPSVLDTDSLSPSQPLNILLVNDDGYQAEGLAVLYNALVAAGHRVTVVAPKQDQSGIGTAINTDRILRPMEVVNYAENQWYVDGTPVVTTLAALDAILQNTPPDLVISGINRGENVGFTATSSGTVGAAIAAIQKGIPAIAISAGIRLEEQSQGYPSTQKAYAIGADYVVNLISDLQSQQGNGKLLPSPGLNINIPATGTVEGVAVTGFDNATSLGFGFGALPNGTGQGLLIVPGSLSGRVPKPNSEGEQFLAGRITVTPLDGSWNTSATTRQALDERVNDGAVVPAAKPLNIMLVNDDGYQAEGINTLYQGLVAAGHHVTLVAPKQEQSGRGTSINTDRILRPMEVVNYAPNQWYVDGTPIVTSIAGIDAILKSQKPDLVISGINQGENLGNTATSSGTVSAAVAAIQRGVPAIAVSAGIKLSEQAQGFPSTRQTYEVATQYVVDLIAQLQATQGSDSILPQGVGLNINVPTVDQRLGTAFTEFDSATSLAIGFGSLPTGGQGLTIAVNQPSANPKPTSEGEQFLAGKITVTPFDGNWGTSDTQRQIAAPKLLQGLTGDADDPAVWINPSAAADSLVITTLKDGGLAVFNLDGSVAQNLTNRPYGEVRYNNVDVLYNFNLGGKSVDLAIATDRNNDTLAIFQIDPTTRQLVNVTDQKAIGTLFQVAPFEPPYSASSRSAYGITTYRSPLTHDSYVFVNRRQTGDVGQYKLVDQGNGKVGVTRVREFTIPLPSNAPEDASPQLEGMVADQELGYLYVGQEDVGIWKFRAEPNGGVNGALIEPVKELGGQYITADVEGLTIYYGKNGTGYLLASSQGDNTFAVYTREGSNAYIGQFGVGSNGSIDSTQESDGAEVINVPLGSNFPFGAFITQDGNNAPALLDDEGENINSNFKFVPWQNIANSLGLTLDTTSYNPRSPQNYVTATANSPSLASTVLIPGNAVDRFPGIGANQNRLGGFGSDLFYDARENIYYAVSDRGPGGGVINYPTRVEKLAIQLDPETGAIQQYKLLETVPFTLAAGTTLNGKTYTQDTPFNGLNARLLSGDSSSLGVSLDPEGIVVGANGNLFVSDEYGPSLYEFTPTGLFIRAFTPPDNILPKDGTTLNFAADGTPVSSGRQDNRGYEGLAISPDGKKLFAALQDPLQNEGTPNGRSSRNLRIVRYDIATGKSDAQYIYQLESLADINDRIPGTADDFGNTSQGRNIGISSITAISDREFLLIERDNRGVGVADVTGAIPVGSKRVYKIDLTGATDVSSIPLTSNALPANVTPVQKTLYLDIAQALTQAGQVIPEKIEGLAIGPRLADGSYALIISTDNDYSVTQDGGNVQFDVYTNGEEALQVPIDSPAPADYRLLPSYLYSFKADAAPLSGYGNDALTGSNDRLLGLAGDDDLNGGAGKDTFTGGAGDDRFVVGVGKGIKTITDFERGDRFVLSDGLTFEQLTIRQGTGNTVIEAKGETLAILLGVEANMVTQSAFTV